MMKTIVADPEITKQEKGQILFQGQTLFKRRF